MRTLYALTVMRHWMRPPNSRVVGCSSSTLTGMHVDGQAHAKRRHRLLGHDAMLPRTLSAISACACWRGHHAWHHRCQFEELVGDYLEGLDGLLGPRENHGALGACDEDGHEALCG